MVALGTLSDATSANNNQMFTTSASGGQPPQRNSKTSPETCMRGGLAVPWRGANLRSWREDECRLLWAGLYCWEGQATFQLRSMAFWVRWSEMVVWLKLLLGQSHIRRSRWRLSCRRRLVYSAEGHRLENIRSAAGDRSLSWDVLGTLGGLALGRFY